MMRGFGYSNAYGMMGGYSPWIGLLGLLFWLLFLAGVVILVIWIVEQSRHGHNAVPLMSGPVGSPPMAGPPQHDEAMAIARKRLATGEITREQFDEIRQALGG
ncbi:MAG: hypothetical protein P4L93_06035 [Coriobacteriia bacterium]|nr:hypothetical protein [Coriobacteriia bacterium]